MIKDQVNLKGLISDHPPMRFLVTLYYMDFLNKYKIILNMVQFKSPPSKTEYNHPLIRPCFIEINER